MANNLTTEKKVQAISMLAEDSSIRAIERITGVHRDTIMRLGVRVGKACEKIHDTKMQGLICKNIEVDEIWGYIGKKQKNVTPAERNTGAGDAWTFIALDSDTKLIPSYLVGKRDGYHADMFIGDLASRLISRIQLSSDGLSSYEDAVERGFGCEVDYGQVVKTYSLSHLGNLKEAATRYSPCEVVKIERNVIMGQPEPCLITTSHIEKQNHTLRMHCRRLTRLTNAFSKKIENFKVAVSQFRVLQFLQDSRRNPMHASDGSGH